MDVVDVDKIWDNVERVGRYQRWQLFVGLISIWSCGFHMLSIVFIGYRPVYQCKEAADNISLWQPNASETVQYEKCTIRRTVNVSGMLTTDSTSCLHGIKYIDEDGSEFDSGRSIISEWELVCGRDELAELSQTLVMIGQAVGAFIFTPLSDRIGRKTTHVGCHICLFCTVLATSFVPSYPWFAFLRTITGVFQQGTGLAIAILNLELFPKEIRAYVEVLGLFFWSTGIALITPLSYIFKDYSWRSLQLCLSCMSAWSLIQWWLFDESLRWLIANGRVDRAKAIIMKACKRNKKDYMSVIAGTGFADLEMMTTQTVTKKPSQGLERSDDNEPLYNGGDVTVKKGTEKTIPPAHREIPKQRRYTIMDLLKSKRLMISSLVMWFAWTTNSLTYYGIMLISSNLAGDRFLNFFLGSVVEYPAAFMEMVIINRYGRKFTAILFHSICAVSLITATILTTTAGGNSTMVICSTIFTLIGKFSIAGSFSTIFLYTPELYPTNMRTIGIGMSSAAARFGGMVAPFARNLADLIVWAPGLVFGTMCLIVSVSLLWVPETNRYELPQTLEECEEWYRENSFTLPCRRRRGNRTIQVPTQPI